MATAARTGAEAGPAARLWSVDDVAEFLGLPRATLYTWSSRRQGPTPYKVGRHLRYDPREVHDWVRAQSNPRTAA